MAIAAFQRAIDHASSRAVTRAEQREVQDSIARMRGQINAMKRRWSFSLVPIPVLDDGCRVGNIAAGDGASGLAFGSVEVAYQPPKIGFRNGKILQIFARLLWAYEPRAFPEARRRFLTGRSGSTLQTVRGPQSMAGAGTSFQIGDDTENNWLARLSWSFTRGTQWQSLLDGETAPDAATPYISLYADVAKFLQHDQELLLLGEARFGRTWQRGKRWLFSPFVYALGRATLNGDLRILMLKAVFAWQCVFGLISISTGDIGVILSCCGLATTFITASPGCTTCAIAGVRFSF